MLPAHRLLGSLQFGVVALGGPLAEPLLPPGVGAARPVAGVLIEGGEAVLEGGGALPALLEGCLPPGELGRLPLTTPRRETEVAPSFQFQVALEASNQVDRRGGCGRLRRGLRLPYGRRGQQRSGGAGQASLEMGDATLPVGHLGGPGPAQGGQFLLRCLEAPRQGGEPGGRVLESRQPAVAVGQHLVARRQGCEGRLEPFRIGRGHRGRRGRAAAVAGVQHYPFLLLLRTV